MGVGSRGTVSKPWADYSGVALSSLCAVHCALTPLVAVILPQFEYFHSPWVHGIFLVLVVPLAVYAFFKCYGEHGRALPAMLGGAGLVFLSSFTVLGIHDLLETGLTVAGSLLLISGHWLNLRYCKHTRSSDVEGRGHRDCC